MVQIGLMAGERIHINQRVYMTDLCFFLICKCSKMHNTNNFCDFAESHKNANTNRKDFCGTLPASFAYFWKFSEPIKDN